MGTRYSHLSLDERCRLRGMMEIGLGISEMARRIDRFVNLNDILRLLAPYYSSTGRPSMNPELLIRMLIVGYCFGIRWSAGSATRSI